MNFPWSPKVRRPIQSSQPLSLLSNREPFANIAETLIIIIIIITIREWEFPVAPPHSGYSSTLIWLELEFDLGSRIGRKLKAKIWADEFIVFASLPTSSPNQANPSNQTRLTLAPCQPSKKIHSFLQWLLAFNNFFCNFVWEIPGLDTNANEIWGD